MIGIAGIVGPGSATGAGGGGSGVGSGGGSGFVSELSRFVLLIRLKFPSRKAPEFALYSGTTKGTS